MPRGFLGIRDRRASPGTRPGRHFLAACTLFPHGLTHGHINYLRVSVSAETTGVSQRRLNQNLRLFVSTK